MTYTNFFALAVVDNNTNQDGSVNFKSSSTNYQFDAEVGAAAVGRSTSSNFILDHGAYWEQYSPPAPTTETPGGGGGGQTIYPNSGSQTASSSPSEIPPAKAVVESIKYNCDSVINCGSIATIKEIDQYIGNQSSPFIYSISRLKTSTNIIPRNIIYLLISLLLILIIMILYITYKRIEHRLDKDRIEDKNKYD